MRCAAVSFLGIVLLSSVASAETCDNYKTPAQVWAAVTSDDPVAKLQAKTCGLNSDDPAVRGLIMQQLLVGLSTMSFDVNPQPKDTSGAQTINQLPQFVVTGMTWSKDGRTFAGGYGNSIVGQFLGQSLGIMFPNIAVKPLKDGDPPQTTSCSATLTLPKGATQLEGPLRCTGIAPRFLITLGI